VFDRPKVRNIFPPPSPFRAARGLCGVSPTPRDSLTCGGGGGECVGQEDCTETELRLLQAFDAVMSMQVELGVAPRFVDELRGQLDFSRSEDGGLWRAVSLWQEFSHQRIKGIRSNANKQIQELLLPFINVRPLPPPPAGYSCDPILPALFALPSSRFHLSISYTQSYAPSQHMRRVGHPLHAADAEGGVRRRHCTHPAPWVLDTPPRRCVDRPERLRRSWWKCTAQQPSSVNSI
jgi:hypothetical protein